jgi:hypothetical protein
VECDVERATQEVVLATLDRELKAVDRNCEVVIVTLPRETLAGDKIVGADHLRHEIQKLARRHGLRDVSDRYRGVGETSMRFYRSAVALLVFPADASGHERRLVEANLRVEWIPLAWDEDERTLFVPRAYEAAALEVIAKHPFMSRRLAVR